MYVHVHTRVLAGVVAAGLVAGVLKSSNTSSGRGKAHVRTLKAVKLDCCHDLEPQQHRDSS